MLFCKTDAFRMRNASGARLARSSPVANLVTDPPQTLTTMSYAEQHPKTIHNARKTSKYTLCLPPQYSYASMNVCEYVAVLHALFHASNAGTPPVSCA